MNKQLAVLSPQQRAGPQGLALQDRAQSLEILAELQQGNAQIAAVATIPTAPSSPKVKFNTVLGGIFGLLLGLGLAFLLERLDRRIKDPDDLERIFKLPLLGMIPDSPAYSRRSSQVSGEALGPLPSREVEVFRLLRARLRYFNVDRDLRLMLVTSADSGDGKTTVVENLAEAAASTGGRVLIIEADLRRPSIAGRLQLRRSPGLAEVLVNASTVEDAIQIAQITPRAAAGSDERDAQRPHGRNTSTEPGRARREPRHGAPARHGRQTTTTWSCSIRRRCRSYPTRFRFSTGFTAW